MRCLSKIQIEKAEKTQNYYLSLEIRITIGLISLILQNIKCMKLVQFIFQEDPNSKCIQMLRDPDQLKSKSLQIDVGHPLKLNIQKDMQKIINLSHTIEYLIKAWGITLFGHISKSKKKKIRFRNKCYNKIMQISKYTSKT